jgi:hypothetical protein
MKHRFSTRLLAAAMIGLSSTPAFADTLFAVPVAGTLQPRRLTTVLSGDTGFSEGSNSSMFATADYNYSRYISLGMTARLTEGVTARPEGSVQFAPLGKPYAFAAGFANVGVRSFRSQPYVVGSAFAGNWGGYFGVTHDSYGEHAMLGANYWATRQISLQVDWIGDDGNFLTFGGRWQARRDIAVTAGFSRANAHDSHNGVFASLEKDFKF